MILYQEIVILKKLGNNIPVGTKLFEKFISAAKRKPERNFPLRPLRELYLSQVVYHQQKLLMANTSVFIKEAIKETDSGKMILHTVMQKNMVND